MILLKAHIKAYVRHGKSGQVVNVREHEDKRIKKLRAKKEEARRAAMSPAGRNYDDAVFNLLYKVKRGYSEDFSFRNNQIEKTFEEVRYTAQKLNPNVKDYISYIEQQVGNFFTAIDRPEAQDWDNNDIMRKKVYRKIKELLNVVHDKETLDHEQWTDGILKEQFADELRYMINDWEEGNRRETKNKASANARKAADEGRWKDFLDSLNSGYSEGMEDFSYGMDILTQKPADEVLAFFDKMMVTKRLFINGYYGHIMQFPIIKRKNEALARFLKYKDLWETLDIVRGDKRYSTYKSKEAARATVLWSWANGTHGVCVSAIQSVCEDEFGLVPNYRPREEKDAELEAFNKVVESFKKSEWMEKYGRKAIKDIYAETQIALTFNKEKRVNLYRGVRSEVVSRSGLESWTTVEQTAKNFDGHTVYAEEIPNEDVFMCVDAFKGEWPENFVGENEWVVMVRK